MSKSLFGASLALLATALIGCGESTDYQTYDAAAESDGSHGGHSHAHEEGPHGGKIVELASDHSVHGEVCLDEGGKSLTFYILGGDLKTPKLAESIEFEVDEDGDEKELPSTPKPLEGEEDGKCSCFTVDSSSLGEMKDLEHLHAHVHVIIEGQEYKGAVADHEHDDHAAHGEEGHEDHDEHEGHDHDGDDHGDDHDKDHDHDDHDKDEHKKD